MNPARASRVSTTGSWKMMPKAKISVMISDRYSLTFGSSSIAASPGTSCCWPMEKRITIGIAMK